MKKNFTKFFILVLIGVLGATLPLSAQFFQRAIVEGPFSVETREIFVDNNGMNIYGIAYIPQNTGKQKMPTVLISHGFGSNNAEGTHYAQSLAQHGYAAYCFDFCCGAHGKSDGKSTDMSIFSEETDLAAVLNAAFTWDFVDPQNVFLWGLSQGGMVSAMVAAHHIDQVNAMILFFPAFCIKDDNTKIPFEEVPDSFKVMGVEIGRPYVEKLYDFDTYAYIGPYNRDVLIVHGDQDRVVNISYSHKAMEVYPHAELKILPGADHGFRGDNDIKAINWSLDFVKAHVKE